MDKQYQAFPKSRRGLSLSESISELMPSFDTMVYMAKHQPDKLEQLRQRLSEKIIAAAPERSRKRLKGLQFEIDMELRKSQSAMGSCIRISRMMNESLLKLCEALDTALTGKEAVADNRELAEVIPFPISH